MIGVRKMLDYVFTKEELKILDDILPEFSRREKLEIEDEIEKEVRIPDPILNTKFSVKFYSTLEFDKSEKPQLVI